MFADQQPSPDDDDPIWKLMGLALSHLEVALIRSSKIERRNPQLLVTCFYCSALPRLHRCRCCGREMLALAT